MAAAFCLPNRSVENFNDALIRPYGGLWITGKFYSGGFCGAGPDLFPGNPGTLLGS
jgi:hypothetical protein